MKRQVKLNKKGYTLVELVLAIALLGIIASLAVVGTHYLSKITNEIMDDTSQQQTMNGIERVFTDYTGTICKIDNYEYEGTPDINEVISKTDAPLNKFRILCLDSQTQTLRVYSVLNRNIINDENSGQNEYQLSTERKVDGISDIKVSHQIINGVHYIDYQIYMLNSNGEEICLLKNRQPLINIKEDNFWTTGDNGVYVKTSGTGDLNDGNLSHTSKVFVLYYDD